MNQYKVIDIFEQDFGCEGRPNSQEYMVNVVLQDVNNNNKITISQSDAMLYKKNIDVGSSVTYDGNNLFISQ